MDHWVVVWTSKDKLVGKPVGGGISDNATAEEVDKAIAKKMELGDPLTLTEVRVMAEFARQTQDGGMARTVVLLPLDIHSGPVKRMQVFPFASFVPQSVTEQANMNKLVENAEQNETTMRAAQAGLVAAGPIPRIARNQ